jgi:hypothetical protein
VEEFEWIEKIIDINSKRKDTNEKDCEERKPDTVCSDKRELGFFYESRQLKNNFLHTSQRANPATEDFIS